jgi:protein MAK11
MARLHSITHAARIQDILFVESAGRSVLLIAAENKKVAAYAIPPRAAAEADAAEAEAEAEGPAPTVFAEFVGHTNRSVLAARIHTSTADQVHSVKALASLRIALPTSPAQPRASTDVLVTISSDGRVLVYDVHALAGLAHDSTAGDVPQLAALAEYDSAGSRLTCLTVAEDPVGPEEKRSADPEGGEDHDPDEGSGSEEDEDRAQLEAEEEPEPEDEEEDA